MKILISCLLYLSLTSTSYAFIKDTAKYLNEKFFSSYGIDIEKLNIDWKSDSLLKKRIIISQKDLCLNITNVENCFSSFELDISFSIPNFLNFGVEKFVLKAKKITIKIPTKKAKSSDPIIISDKLKMLKYWLVGKNIKNVEILVKNLKLYQGDSVSTSSIELNTDKSESIIKGRIEYKTPEMHFTSNIFLRFKDKVLVKLDNKVTASKLESRFRVNLELTEKQVIIDLSKIEATISKNFEIVSKGCRAKFKFKETIPLVCQKISIELHKKRSLYYDIYLKAMVNDLIDLNKNSKLVDLSVYGKQSTNSPYKLNLNTKLSVNIENKKINNRIDSFNLKLFVSNFKKFVSYFEDSFFAIPAPFNVLEGSLNLSSSLKYRDKHLLFPIKGDIRLVNNPSTKFEAKLSSNVKVNTNFLVKEIDLDFKIKKLHFYTPYIDPIYGIPQVTSTKKISKEIKNKKVKPLGFKVNLNVSTTNNKSIKVYNELFDPSLIFGFKAKVNNQEETIELDFAPGAKIVYLKRTVEIKKVNIQNKKGESLINANFEYNTSGYLINFNVVGTLDAPRLILSSFPSLPREDIISLLIYNRKTSELSSLDRSSVGSTQDAISNRALGLFSIWAFASTPIESVSYNQESKTYNAVVSLPGNTSVDIGTTGERVSTLSFRKRLSENWAIVTTFEPTDEDSKESVLLQKEVNY